MVTATTSIKFISLEPTVINTGNELYVSIPIMNTGTDVAFNIFVNSITVGSASRLSPQILPVFMGKLGNGNNASVNARFSALGLVPGQKYLLTVRGTYEAESTTAGFAVNRYVLVPATSAFPINLLKARVQVELQPLLWNYTIYNDEPKESQQFVAALSLTVAAPVEVSGVPAGWDVETDNLTYVLWYAADQNMPYPHHIPPGQSLSGFQILSSAVQSESTPYVVTSWRHDTNQAGLVVTDYVATPRRIL
jgi:hypothetical protein